MIFEQICCVETRLRQLVLEHPPDMGVPQALQQTSKATSAQVWRVGSPYRSLKR
jgi:hypothetical protein